MQEFQLVLLPSRLDHSFDCGADASVHSFDTLDHVSHVHRQFSHISMCGSHARHPSLWVTDTVMASSDSLSPTDEIGGSSSQSLIIIIIIIIIIVTRNLLCAAKVNDVGKSEVWFSRS